MILHAETTYNTVKISYVNKNGLREFLELPKELYEWVYDTNGTDISWEGLRVSKRKTYRMNNFNFLELTKPIEVLKELNFPKMYSVDIETYVGDEFPSPEKVEQPITAITITSPLENGKVKSYCMCIKDGFDIDKIRKRVSEYFPEIEVAVQVKYFETESSMLIFFLSELVKKCPAITGWNFTKFDWPYITNRALKFGISPEIASPTGTLKYKSNNPYHVAIYDYLDLFKTFQTEFDTPPENMKLDYIASEVLGKSKLHYAGSLNDLYNLEFDTFLAYNIIDTILVTLLHAKSRCAEALLGLSNYCGLDCDSGFGPVALTEALMWKYFDKQGVRIVDKPRNSPKEDYEGGFVKEPQKGLHFGVAVTDANSLYPTIKRTFGYSPENFLGQAIPEEFKNYPVIKSALGNYYLADKPYSFEEIQTELGDERDKFKNMQLHTTNVTIPLIENELKRRLSESKK